MRSRRRTAAWAGGGVVAGLLLGTMFSNPSGPDAVPAAAPLPTATATATATATVTTSATATATATVTAAAAPAPTKTVRVRTTVTAKPKPRPTVTKTVYGDDTSSDASEDQDVYYSNCSEARAAGDTPLYRGDPGYGSHLDGDDDGVACES